MKKSRAIRLVLLGSASVALTACGDEGVPPDARFFADLKDCVAVHGEAACGEARAEAERVHATEAPRFAQKQACEAEFGAGNCETRQTASGDSVFLPMLMGYMIGNALAGNRFSQPVYRGADNAAVMPKGGKAFNVGSFPAGAGVQGAANFRPAAQVTQVARGGFGSTATAFRSTAGS